MGEQLEEEIPQYRNQVLLIGYLGRDPEKRGETLTFSLATESEATSKTGATLKRTEWHRIVCRGTTRDQALRFKKGSHVVVFGELVSREYGKEIEAGGAKYSVPTRIWEILALEVNPGRKLSPSLN